jgi:hypothetical protein
MKSFLLIFFILISPFYYAFSSSFEFTRIKGVQTGFTIKGGFIHKDTMFLNRNYAGLHYSTDDGNTWQRKNNNLPDQYEFEYIQYGDSLLIANNFKSLLISNDFGKTWIDRSMQDKSYMDYQFIAKDTNLFILWTSKFVNYPYSEKFLFYSIDQGKNWNILDNQDIPKSYNFAINNQNEIFTIGKNNQIIKSNLLNKILQESKSLNSIYDIKTNSLNTLISVSPITQKIIFFQNCDLSNPQEVENKDSITNILVNDENIFLYNNKEFFEFDINTKTYKSILKFDSVLTLKPFELSGKIFIPFTNHFIFCSKPWNNWKEKPITEHLLNDTNIICSEVMNNGELMVSSQNGLYYSETNYRYWYKVNNDVLNSQKINKILNCGNSYVFVTLENKLKITDSNFANTHFLDYISIKDSITQIGFLAPNSVIIVTIGGAFYIDLNKNPELKPIKNTIGFTKLHFIDKKLEYLSCDNKIFKFNNTSYNLELIYTFPDSIRINSIITNSNGFIFIGTNFGIFRSDLNKFSFYEQNKFLQIINVTELYKYKGSYIIAFGKDIYDQYLYSYSNDNGQRWKYLYSSYIFNKYSQPVVRNPFLMQINDSIFCSFTDFALWKAKPEGIIDSNTSWIKSNNGDYYYNDFVFRPINDIFMPSQNSMITSHLVGDGFLKYYWNYYSGTPDSLKKYSFHSKVNTQFQVSPPGYRIDIISNTVIKLYYSHEIAGQYTVFIDVYNFDTDSLLFSFTYITKNGENGAGEQLLTFELSYNSYFNGRYLNIDLSENWVTNMGGKYPKYTNVNRNFFLDLNKKIAINNPFEKGYVSIPKKINVDNLYYLISKNVVKEDSSIISIYRLDFNSLSNELIFETKMKTSISYVGLDYSKDEQKFYFANNNILYLYNKKNSTLQQIMNNFSSTNFILDEKGRCLLSNISGNLTFYDMISCKIIYQMNDLNKDYNIPIYLANGSNAFIWIYSKEETGYYIFKYQSDFMTSIFFDYYFHPDYTADDMIYPNPASVIINFKVPMFAEQMIIKDIFGNECLTLKNLNGLTSIDVSKLSSGIYFLNIINNKQIKIHKFVIII